MQRWFAVAALAIVAVCVAPARAEDAGDFYRGRTVEIVVGSSPGGGYDQYARMIARHMGRHMPGNPSIVVKNMDGAAGLRLANWLFAAAPRDGTVIGAVSRAMAFEPLLGNKAAQYDASKLTYIGSASDEVSVCVAWHTSGVATWADALTKELVVGSSGTGDDTYQFPALLKNLFGARFKIISGYPGGNEINLALERGEVQGRCGIPWSTVKATRQVWLDEKRINILMQFSLAKHADLPAVPLVTELARNDEDARILKLVFGRQTMGRPYAAPPAIPKERVEALRRAFTATLADKELMADIEKAKFEIGPVSGEKLEALVHEVYQSTSPALAEKAAAMMR